MSTYWAYTRVSTDVQGQKETSLIVQENYLKERAKFHNMTCIVKKEVQSGKNLEGREVLVQLIKTLKAGDILGVYDDSRLSRNTEDSIKIATALANIGAKLEVAGKFVDIENPTDELTYIINSAIAQYSRKVQNSKAKASIQLKRQNGDYVSNSRFFGYDMVKKRGKAVITVNQEEAKIVQYLFDSFLNGVNIYNLRKDTGLSSTRIKDILVNPLYMGYFCLEQKKKAVHPEILVKENFIKSNNYPAIITEDLYWKVVAKYKTFHKSRDYAWRQSVHTLSGVFKSECCGAGLVYMRNIAATDYYAVTAHRVGCTCTDRFITRLEELESITYLLTLITLKSGIEVSSFYEEQKARLYEDVEAVEKDLDDKNKELKKLQEQEKRLLELAISADISEELFRNKQSELKQKQKDLSHMIASLKNVVLIKKGDIEDLIESQNEDTINEFLVTENRRDFYFNHIKKAIIHQKDIELLFKNGKGFLVNRRKTRSPKEHEVDFKMYFREEEQATGSIDFKDSRVSFYRLVGKDKETEEYLNSYYTKLAEEVNALA